MRLTTCPKCGAKVSPSDTKCLDCGADLVEAMAQAKERLRQQAVAVRTGQADTSGPAAGGAAAGTAVPGETSEETRLRIFDQQAAEGLAQEARTSYVIAVLTFAAGVVLSVMGFARFKMAGSLAGLTMSVLRNWAMFTDDRVLALIFGGVGIGALAVGIGVFLRALGATRAVRDVKAGTKPTIVTLNPFLQIGLLLIAIFCPPLGIIVAIPLKFSDDSDIRAYAQFVINTSLAVIAVLILNILWGLAENFRAAHVPAAGNRT